jgi:hypothetical protein
MNKTILKYLSQYAETESIDVSIKSHQYDCVIVIPICNESMLCLHTVFKNISAVNILIIAVVNSPKSPKNKKWQSDNQLFINEVCKNSDAQFKVGNNIQLYKYDNSNDILLIDRNSDGQQIDAKQGVGLARKIGCDVALKLYALDLIKCPWIFSTDADVILPENYFENSFLMSDDYSTLALNFEHFSDDSRLNQLQYYYDFKLRYYHAGIKYANTHYDYIPLGSTLVVSMMSYAQVRGFPKKNAGEDFYLLNKLAKIKPVYYEHDVVVKIQSRFSNRVPFGTGPALSKINSLNSIDDYKYYNPQCFLYLKKWQKYLDSLYHNAVLKITTPEDLVLQGLYKFFNCQILFQKSSHQITSRQRWAQFIMQWFDAFRTLKAVHYFDKIFPQENYKQLLKSHNFVKVANPSLQHFMQKNDKN